MFKYVMILLWLLMGFVMINMFWNINYSRLFKKNPSVFKIKVEHCYKDRWKISFTDGYWFNKQYLLKVQDWTEIDAGVEVSERTFDKLEAI